MAKEEEEEGEPNINRDQTPPPPPPSPLHPQTPNPNPNPNPRKRTNPTKDLLPSLSNCHSCGLHFPSRSQTLTHLHPLDSQWRVALLCGACLRLLKSRAKCSYCFSDLSADIDSDRLLDCLQCWCRVHSDCVPAHQRFDPEGFSCVDCCPMPRLGRKKKARASVEELVREAGSKAAEAARAKERAFEKVRAAMAAVERAREAVGAANVAGLVGPVVRDEELALKLHLAMNGSRRISRSGGSMSSRVGSEKVGICKEDEGCSDEVVDFGEDGSTLAVWMASKRGSKSKKAGSEGKSLGKKPRVNGVVASGNSSFESDRCVKKYSRRKLFLKKLLDEESEFWRTS